jgi:cell division septum initiation protein DivIVA
LSGEETEFPIAMRGYERGPVDDALLDLRKEILQLSAANAQLAAELKNATKRLEQAEAQLNEVGDPTYTGVGARAALILSAAEDQAAHLTKEANLEAEKLRRELAHEIDTQRGEAKGYYDSLVSEAQRRADRIINAARSDYDEIIKQARSEAGAIADESTREASSIRGAISTEVAKMRANAKREIESNKAKTDRDLAERKLMAFRDNTREIDLEFATSLLTEQARIDLELELTARRAEAEAEYLSKHQEAVAATQKYLDDANSQLANALARANAARLEAETLEAAAISVNQQTTLATRKKADAIIAAADAEAREILSDAKNEAATRLAQANKEVERIQGERDSVEVYMRNLRKVLDGAQYLRPSL